MYRIIIEKKLKSNKYPNGFLRDLIFTILRIALKLTIFCPDDIQVNCPFVNGQGHKTSFLNSFQFNNFAKHFKPISILDIVLIYTGIGYLYCFTETLFGC